MSDYKLTLQSHNNELQELINMANELPDKVEGVQLNFEVVGGLEQPANPTENMIWVNTDIEITGWVFRVIEPTEPTDGMIWISTGISSTAEFNALKNNGIQVYPNSVKQYISGAWVLKDVKVRKQNDWVDLDTYLYRPGDECEDITGGWEALAMRLASTTSTGVAPLITYLEDGSVKMVYNRNTGGGGVYRTKNKVNLSEYSGLVFTGYINELDSHNYMALCIWSNMGTYSTSNIVAQLNGPHGGTIVTFEPLDISELDGEYYIGFKLYSNSDGSEVLMKELKLTR